MSLAAKTAVYDLLCQDAPLGEMLADDPNLASEPALFPGSSIDALTPVYPCLTYRISEGTPDKRFGPKLLPVAAPKAPAAGQKPQVQNLFLDAEAWCDGSNTAPAEKIAERLEMLLGDVQFPTTEGRVRSRCLMKQLDLYDKTLRAHFVLLRFHLHVTTRPPQ